MHTILILVLW